MNIASANAVSLPRLPAGFALAGALLAVLAIYADTARSIVSIWNSSETFAHGYIILPISLWLIWRRRAELGRIAPQPFWPALLLIAGAGFAWLLAELAEVQVVRQYAFVAMLLLTVLAVAGLRLSLAMTFPLAFLLLAVPFGEIFVAPLINFTADFTVSALQLTGVPVLRNGSNFEIPTGSWSVVEACSGVRYLISSFTLGCLYAYLNYRSPVRRFMFVVLSIVVPIIANGMRAYMIVMLGHLSGNKLAAGVDHLIYGWIFFGLVMFLMFWIGGFWRDDTAEVEEAPAAASAPAASLASLGAAAAACIACVAVWPAYAHYLDRAAFNPEPVRLDNFHASWPNAPAFTDWRPGFTPAALEVDRFYQGQGTQVGMSIRYYRNQQDGAKLISSANRLVKDKEKRWRPVASNGHSERIGEHDLVLREGRVQGDGSQFLVWSWYWIDGHFIANDYLGKLLQAKEMLVLHGDDGAAILVYAPYESNPEEARKAMRAFLSDNLAHLESALAANRK